jgi:hypothetical protein
VAPASIKAFTAELERQIDSVFRTHPELVDHRAEYPWLTGCLGDRSAPVWLIAENPSLNQVRRLDADATPEAQWSASRGDELLRHALVEADLKTGDPFEAGGWNCWLTDVIKSADVVTKWAKTSAAYKKQVAEWWAPVLRYELEQGRPRHLIVLGKNADSYLSHLERNGLLPQLPPRTRVAHYSYIAMRPETATGRGPGHPGRIAEWTTQIVNAATSAGAAGCR